MFRKQHHSIPIPLHLCISGGTLRFYGEWFGRPFDNFHVVQTAVRTKNALHIQFSEKEELTASHTGTDQITRTLCHVACCSVVRLPKTRCETTVDIRRTAGSEALF